MGRRAVMAWSGATASCLAALGSTSGCVIEAAPPPPGGAFAVSGPPPAPMDDARRPPPPALGAVWIHGYWHWTGVQYAWIPGHWETAPPGVVWRAPHYSLREGTYFYEPGTWVRR